MTGDPPIGTEDSFPKADPDETVEERRVRLAGQTPLGTTGPTDTGSGVMPAESRADAIVRRESGVTDFSQAGDQDRAGGYQIEDYPSQDDPSSAAGMRRDDPLDDSPADTAARGVNDLVQGAERVFDPDADIGPRTRR